jgi:uncharacterized membrane protein
MKTQKITQHSQNLLSAALASSILAAALVATPVLAGDKTKMASERCADIVKGGKNTCAVKSLGISCQGNATEDNMAGAWIKVPAGTCANIVNICTDRAGAPEGTDVAKLEKACGKIAEQEADVAGGRVVDKNGDPV